MFSHPLSISDGVATFLNMADLITSVTCLPLERQFSGVWFLLPQPRQMSLTRMAFTSFLVTW